MQRAGYRVGLLDADIYGPSIPTMLGVTGRPVSLDGKTIEPLERFGVKLMSIGFLLEDPKAAVIWRGPMLHGALQQFMKDVNWGELDFLVLDLPPGTGDVALTLSQKVKVDRRGDGDDAAAGGDRRRLQERLDVQEGEHPDPRRRREHELLHRHAGVQPRALRQGRRAGGGRVREGAAPRAGAARSRRVREWGDKGTPVVQAAPESSVAQAFIAIAERLVEIVEKKVEDEAPLIDRSGGAGRKRLPITK